MTTVTNIQDYTTNSITQDFFNNYFSAKQTISIPTNDIVLSYFEKFTGTSISGTLMASAFIQGCIQQNVDPLLAISELTDMTQKEQMTYMSFLMNSTRTGTSALGISSTPSINQYIARTLVN